MIDDLLRFRRLLRARYLSADELRMLQDSRLRALVQHAYEKVPYYRRLFASVGLDPRDVRGVADLERIPITTKQDLVDAGIAAVLTEGVDPAATVVHTTTGTSGLQLAVHRDRAEFKLRRLCDFRALLTAGLRARDRLVVLGPAPARARGFHQRLGLFRSENIPTRLPLDEQLARLYRTKPTVLWAYPTTLLAVVERSGGRLFERIRPRIIITSAENFDPFVRARTLRDDTVETFNFYGSHEAGRIAYECRAHDALHVAADQVLLECIDGDSPAAAGGTGSTGEAVVTNLGSYTMPFIRYRLGDRVRWQDGGTCRCGSAFPKIAPPQGRVGDMIRLPSGGSRSPLGVGHVIREFPQIVRFRLVQKSPSHLVLLVVAPGVTRDVDRETMRGALRAKIAEYVGEPLRVDVELVDEIPEDRVKFRFFVSEIDRPAS